MSSEPEMNDAQFTNVFSILIGGLIVLTIVLIILAVIIGSGVQKSDINAQSRDQQVVERIAPVGQITVGEAGSTQSADSGAGDAGGDQAAAGDAVYQNNCAACHASGVAGAPTFGDEAAWSGRIDKGVETLYSNAIDGFQGDAGVMPPKGGNASLSDEEVKAAVDHMVSAVSESGGSEAADSEAADSEAADSEAADSETADSETADSGTDDSSESQAAAGEAVYQSSCMACHASGVAGAPKLGDSEAWSSRIAKGMDTLYTHAIDGFQGDTGMMPPKGGNTSLSDEEVKAAVDHMVSAVSESGGSEAADSGTADSGTADSGTADSGTADSGTADSEAADSDTADSSESRAAAGEAVYQSSCMACHASGVAGAPRLGDSEAWSDRIAKGMDTLYTNAIDGFQGDTGMMPPKGGNTSLSDEEVQAAVDYMVEQSE